MPSLGTPPWSNPKTTIPSLEWTVRNATKANANTRPHAGPERQASRRAARRHNETQTRAKDQRETGQPPSHKSTSPTCKRYFPRSLCQALHAARVCRTVIRTARFHHIELDGWYSGAFLLRARCMQLLSASWMRRLEAVVSHRARCRQSKVHDGSPALQFVMAVMMEQI